MISATQREALAVLGELCELSHDVRLGQLLAHLGFLGEDETARTLWDIDDEQLLAIMYRHRTELTARLPARSTPALSLSGDDESALNVNLKSTTPPTNEPGGR